MNDKNKKLIQNITEGVIIVGVILALFFAYKAGFHAGQVEFCSQNELTLIKYRGVSECWDDFRIEEYEKQWGVNSADGLQFNIS